MLIRISRGLSHLLLVMETGVLSPPVVSPVMQTIPPKSVHSFWRESTSTSRTYPVITLHRSVRVMSCEASRRARSFRRYSRYTTISCLRARNAATSSWSAAIFSRTARCSSVRLSMKDVTVPVTRDKSCSTKPSDVSTARTSSVSVDRHATTTFLTFFVSDAVSTATAVPWSDKRCDARGKSVDAMLPTTRPIRRHREASLRSNGREAHGSIVAISCSS